MIVSYKTFNMFAISLAVLAIALLPAWPYSRWGYFPSMAVAVGVVVLFMLRKLQSD